MPWLSNPFRRSGIEASAHSVKLEMTADVAIEAARADVEGSLPRFSIHGYTGNSMKLAGWNHPVILDLAGLKAEKQNLPALRAHNDDRLVGHTDAVRVDADGMHFEGVISGVGVDAQEIVATSKAGLPWQASVGADPVPGSVRRLAAGKSAVVNGRTVHGPHYIVGEAIVSEISFVPRGADRSTSAAIAAQFKDDDMNFEQWLQAKGIEAASLTDPIRAALQQQFDAENGAEGTPKTVTATKAVEADDIKAMIASEAKAIAASAVTEALKSVQEENDRKASIVQATAGYPEIQAKAVAEKWSLEKAELEVIRASRPQPLVASTGTDGSPDSGEVIRAALCVNAGLAESALKDSFDDKVIDAAMAGRLRGFGIHALMHEVIRASGRSMAPGMANDEFIRAAFQADQQIKASGVSTLSLSTTLGDVVNKFIVAGFNNVDQAWRQIAAIGSVKDFRTATGARLTGDFKYLKLGQDGEIKHAAMSETTYTNRAETYARMFGLTRQDLINDDLGNLESTARLKLGRGAGKALNEALWTAFMDNSSFFTAGRGNYDEDVETALSITGLTLADTLFRNQTDEDGDPAEIEPAILLVPNALRVTADQLMGGFPIYPTTPGATNPFAGRYKVVSTPYLSNANITGNSTTAWYLLADPNTLGVGVIQVVFLNGKQTPTVESAELDFYNLGIQMRGYMDFGVAKQEYRAGVKMEGVNV